MDASAAEILIVEDDEVITGTLAYNLSRHGFSVKGATTGAEALRIARKMRPDLILLDVMLPGESGVEVCERIRERDQEVVIVMVTAKDAEDDKVRGFEAGADDYVTKPFGMKELVARINANLKRSETGGRGKILEALGHERDHHQHHHSPLHRLMLFLVGLRTMYCIRHHQSG